VADTFVVLLRVHLFFPESGSLKAKRAELNSLKAHLRSTLAVALSGGSAGRCEDAADAICRALDARFPQGVRVERRLASWGDLEAVG
jgi:hypothetical protein